MDTQPSNSSDFEVLTAIVSRVCIGFMDLEQVFPHANPDDALETLSRLRDEGRIVSERYGSPFDDKWRLKVVSRTIPGVSETENFEGEDEG